MTPAPLSRQALNRALLARQMLLARQTITTAEAVGRLAGLQAQQAQPPFVGLWTRLAGFAREDLTRPILGRQVVRATLMRGTLHLIGAEDYLAWRATFQPILSAGMLAVLKDRAGTLDVPALVAEARALFLKRPRTFTELRDALMATHPDGDERAMGFAVRTHLPLVSVPDQSPWAFRADPDFAPAEAWLGRVPDVEERLDAVALRHLAAFGPSAAVDVQEWSGLGGMKAVLDRLRPNLVTFRDDRKRELFDLPDAPRPHEDTPSPARFLPGFDGVVLAHKDRSRIIAEEHRPKVATRNLQVLPTFLIDGMVAGTWKASRTKKAATLALSPFAPLPAKARKELESEGQALARFLEPVADRHEISLENP